MAKAIYDVQVPNIGEVERALGDMRDKAPRAMKNAVNQTATRAKNMMIRQARLRYAVPMARGLLVPLDKFKDTRVALENPKSSAGILFAAVKAALN